MVSSLTADGLRTSWADWCSVAETLESSYKQNDYGNLIYGIVRGLQPKACVEIGVLNGYSTLHIGAALRDNEVGHLDAFDLWEGYPYKHGNMAEVQTYLDKVGLSEWVTLHHCDALHVPGELTVTPDLVHIDISNDGQTYLWAASVFGQMLGGSKTWLLLEGGTRERDEIDWMQKGSRLPIHDAIEFIQKGWHIVTFSAFPGLTMMRQR